MKIVAASQTEIEVEFEVTKSMSNFGDTLHGGAAATAVDLISTLGIMCVHDCNPASVNLSMK